MAYNSSNKTSLQLSNNYSNSKNNLINASIASFLSLPPNTPLLHTEEGKLNWQEGGFSFDNPLSYLLCKYSAETESLLSNLQIEYKVLPEISIRSSFGYSSMLVSEKSITPIASQNPDFNPDGSLTIGNNSYKSWIAEPQIEYEKSVGNGRLSILIGSTFSQNKQNTLFVSASGYTSDNLISSLNAGTISSKNNGFSDYKYTALFGRLTYNLEQKYLVNLTGRRDGSSRFGPGKRFANFGAVGVGWLFYKEQFISKLIPALSFGKIRASYGLTGNDQIGNYKYLNTWSSFYSYQGVPTLYPSALYNALYGWETNKKFEAALEIGLFNDRLYFSSSYFNNRSSNQLVSYALPLTTGFVEITRNFPALIRIRGLNLN